MNNTLIINHLRDVKQTEKTQLPCKGLYKSVSIHLYIDDNKEDKQKNVLLPLMK